MLKFGKRFVVLIAFLTMFVVVFATSGAYSYWAGTVESPAEETKEVIIQAGNWPKPQKPPKQWPPSESNPLEPGDIVEYNGEYYLVRVGTKDPNPVPGSGNNKSMAPYNKYYDIEYDYRYSYRTHDIVSRNGIYYRALQNVPRVNGPNDQYAPGSGKSTGYWVQLAAYSATTAYQAGWVFTVGTGTNIVFNRTIQTAPAGTSYTNEDYFTPIIEMADHYWMP